MLYAKSTTKDNIRADGELHKEICIYIKAERTRQAGLRPEEQSEKAESCRKN